MLQSLRAVRQLLHARLTSVDSRQTEKINEDYIKEQFEQLFPSLSHGTIFMTNFDFVFFFDRTVPHRFMYLLMRYGSFWCSLFFYIHKRFYSSFKIDTLDDLCWPSGTRDVSKVMR